MKRLSCRDALAETVTPFDPLHLIQTDMHAPQGSRSARKAPDNVERERLHIRVTLARRTRWQAAANAADLSIADWAGDALDAAAGDIWDAPSDC